MARKKVQTQTATPVATKQEEKLKNVFDLTIPQKKDTNLLERGELQAYIEWLKIRNYEGGTVEEWKESLHSKNIVLRKITELTPEQQNGIKSLTGYEVRKYLIYLSARGYEGGTIPQWQASRLQDLQTKKEVPVAIWDERGPQFERRKI